MLEKYPYYDEKRAIIRSLLCDREAYRKELSGIKEMLPKTQGFSRENLIGTQRRIEQQLQYIRQEFKRLPFPFLKAK